MKIVYFDEATCAALQYYVYMLIDPRTNTPFYIGKGDGNRVFQHVLNVQKSVESNEPKSETIREILQSNLEVEHIIVHHGMDEQTAFLVESSLIDAFNFYYGKKGIAALPSLTNLVKGHDTQHGLQRDIEIRNRYSAQRLTHLADDCIVININKLYPKCKTQQDIYDATKASWVIAKKKVNKITTVLSEYRGLIVEVFSVDNWYPIEVKFNKGSKAEKTGKTRIRFGFIGKIAQDGIRDLYIGKSLPPYRKQNPILYPAFVNALLYNSAKE